MMELRCATAVVENVAHNKLASEILINISGKNKLLLFWWFGNLRTQNSFPR